MFQLVFSRPTLISNSQKIALHPNLKLSVCRRDWAQFEMFVRWIQDLYLKSYTRADALQRRLQATNAFLKQYPRYAIENLLRLIAFMGFFLATRTVDLLTLFHYWFTAVGAQ